MKNYKTIAITIILGIVLFFLGNHFIPKIPKYETVENINVSYVNDYCSYFGDIKCFCEEVIFSVRHKKVDVNDEPEAGKIYGDCYVEYADFNGNQIGYCWEKRQETKNICYKKYKERIK